MPCIKIKLADIIEELEITKNKVAVESKVRPNTISDLVNEKSVAINFDTLVKIISTLNRIAENEGFTKRYKIEDVIEYKEK